jgi:cytochrome c oxidase subunit 1
MADQTFPIPGSLDVAPSRGAAMLEWLHGWVVTVDHKRLGILYVVYALFFLVVAGGEAMAIRIQLAVPNNHFLSPELFNEFFTMHGTTMVFLVGMTIIFGIGNYLVPLMIGARDMAFPRLNAFSFWLSAFGGLFLYFSFIGGFGLYGMGSAPDVTWWAYAPLTAKAFSPGHNTDYWALALIVMGFGTLGAAINILATAFSMRCRGMTLLRMPLFVWLMVVTSGLTLITITPLTAAQIMLIIDRYLGGHFFDAQAGGAPIVWMHFFWIFGHPEVYVLILPAFGIKIFNWVATMWGGKIRFATPMLFCTAFLFQFLCAGLTGIMLSVSPWDWQLHNSYFVIAHFHYTLAGSFVFCMFAAICYWYPKVTGRMLSEKLGKWHFWLFFIGFHLTFDTMHFVGMLGMPRSIYTYEADRGWNTLNFWISIGGLIQAVGVLIFTWNLIRSYWHGKEAGNDPWDAWTLEWSTPSPPPAYNFAEDPVVRSRRPLWDLKHPQDPDWKYER